MRNGERLIKWTFTFTSPLILLRMYVLLLILLNYVVLRHQNLLLLHIWLIHNWNRRLLGLNIYWVSRIHHLGIDTRAWCIQMGVRVIGVIGIMIFRVGMVFLTIYDFRYDRSWYDCRCWTISSESALSEYDRRYYDTTKTTRKRYAYHKSKYFLVALWSSWTVLGIVYSWLWAWVWRATTRGVRTITWLPWIVLGRL